MGMILHPFLRHYGHFTELLSLLSLGFIAPHDQLCKLLLVSDNNQATDCLNSVMMIIYSDRYHHCSSLRIVVATYGAISKT
jgi:hypothetical protein